MKTQNNNLLYSSIFTLSIFSGIVLLFLIIGTLFVYSSSSAYALHLHGNPNFYLTRHLYGILLGIIGGVIIQAFPPRAIQRLNKILLFFFITLVFLTQIGPFATQINGSFRWISLKGFMFQPSELLKHSLIIFTADFLASQAHKKVIPFSQLIYFFGIIILASVLLLQQPDFGLVVTLMLTLFFLFFIAHYNIRILSSLIISFIITSLTLIFIKPYRMRRIFSFLDPWKDPQGNGFQLIQSFTSFGLGYWFGNGIGYSKQKFFYLPMQHTDFIFSIIGEELGFIGIICIIMLYIAFIFFGYKLARECTTLFSFFTIVGYITLTSLQTIINMSVATGLVPPKGIGLPFISYGNTSLVCNLWMISVIITIIRHANRNSGNIHARTKNHYQSSYQYNHKY